MILYSREVVNAAFGFLVVDLLLKFEQTEMKLIASQLFFSFCPRGCIKLAHALAARGARCGEAWSLWLEALLNFACVPVTSVSAECIE
jgi:hypothetical protein